MTDEGMLTKTASCRTPDPFCEVSIVDGQMMPVDRNENCDDESERKKIQTYPWIAAVADSDQTCWIDVIYEV